jgi:hypothetical protein
MANTKDFKAKNRVTPDVLHEAVASVTSSSGAMTIDMASAGVFTTTLTEDTEITFTNVPAAGDVGTVTLVATANSGSYALSYANQVNFAGETYVVDTDTWVLVFKTTNGGSYFDGTYAVKRAS